MPDEEELLRYLRKATSDLAQSRARIRELEHRQSEAIAVVGMSCRYPGGVRSGDDLWSLVDTATDAISELPVDRGWDLEDLYDPDPDHPGTSYVRHGGFIDAIADFDPAFFGISPREALAMDPQQRLLLELSWELLEDAGLDPDGLRRSDTATYVGANINDYISVVMSDPRFEGYMGLGNSTCVLSGRLAYSFGFEGPAVTVETACSSSLVAVHLACQGLRAGDCSLAVAGGVTVMSTPGSFVEFSRQRGLSPDGRCRSFSSTANGTSWAEGAGLVLLERLSDAQRLGHDIQAVIVGSAVNQDGASNGLAAPNGPSQRRVIRSALTSAGLSPTQVQVVEAHGTGTILGDPIEADALLATYGQGRGPDHPLWLGSLKSNIGHAQAASGIGGVIKMILAMRHETMPRSLHVDEPTPAVDWSSGSICLLEDARPWTVSPGEPRRAGVSSFGMSGTNAHVIIEEPPTPPDPVESEDSEEPFARSGDRQTAWVLSARSRAALVRGAEQLAVMAGDHEISDVGYSLSLLPQLEHRAVVVGATDELWDGIRNLAEGGRDTNVIVGRKVDGRDAFVFPGQGSQRTGMGRELYESFPAYADALDELAEAFRDSFELPVRDVMFRSDLRDRLDTTLYAQPAIFIHQVALTSLLEHGGVRPDALIGHSIGELSAAHVAGIFTIEDSAAIVGERARAMQDMPAGEMVAVHAPSDVIEPMLGALNNVSIAALNSPSDVVLSGEAGAIAEIATMLDQAGLQHTKLRVQRPFHSRLVDAEVLDPLRRVLETIEPATPSIPIVSTLLGSIDEDHDMLAVDYWLRQAREPVNLTGAVQAAEQWRVRTFIEVGSSSGLTAIGPDSLQSTASEFVNVQRGADDQVACFDAAISQLWTRGSCSHRTPFPVAGQRVKLPGYSFDRRRLWAADNLDEDFERAAWSAGDELDGPDVELLGRLASAPSHLARTELLASAILDELGAVLGWAVNDEAPSDDVTFRELGLDSLGVSQLRRRLTARLGIEIAPTTFYDHPTISEFASAVWQVSEPASDTESLIVAADHESVLRSSQRLSDPIADFLVAGDVVRARHEADRAAAGTPQVERLSEGQLGTVVCIPSLLPLCGHQQFWNLAAALTPAFGAVSVVPAGFIGDGVAARSWESLVGAVAEAVADIQPTAIVGYSSSAALAVAVALSVSPATASVVAIDPVFGPDARRPDVLTAAFEDIDAQVGLAGLPPQRFQTSSFYLGLLPEETVVEGLDAYLPILASEDSLGVRDGVQPGAAAVVDATHGSLLTDAAAPVAKLIEAHLRKLTSK